MTIQEMTVIGEQYLKDRFGSSNVRVNEEIHSSISWRPTLQVRRRYSIIAAEVSDVLCPTILRVASPDVRLYELPISVMVFSPFETYIGDRTQAGVRQLKRDGIGLVTIDSSGDTAEHLSFVPFAQHIAEEEVTVAIKGLPNVVCRRFKNAYRTYAVTPTAGLQEASQTIEIMVGLIGDRYSTPTMIKKGLAALIDDLYANPALQNERAGLAGARSFVQTYRNKVSHSPKNGKEAKERILLCRTGFMQAMSVGKQLALLMKTHGIRCALPAS